MGTNRFTRQTTIHAAMMPGYLLDTVNSTVTTSTCQEGRRGVESRLSYVDFKAEVDEVSVIPVAPLGSIGRRAILPHLSSQSCPQQFDPTE